MRKRVEDTRLVTLGTSKPYSVKGADEMRGVKPPKMLVAGMLPAGMLCGLTSYPGVGKTWLALELARAVVTGGKGMDEFDVLGGPQGVLVVGSDSSDADYARQWVRLTAVEHKAWLDEMDRFADANIPRDQWPTNPFALVKFLIQSTFMLDNADEVRRIIKTVLDEKVFPVQRTVRVETDEDGDTHIVDQTETGGCALIVMDTLSRLTVANQNDNTEMERVFANLRVICEVTGAAVLLLHHNSKPTEYNDGMDWRGAMSQIGALDSWINLSNSKRDRNKVRAEFKKFRGITPESFEYQMAVSDPDTAKLTYLGQSGGFFGADDLKTEIARVCIEWKTMAAIEEAMWPSYSDRFKDRGKFKGAIRNRINNDMYPDKLERRGKPRAFEYKTKDACPTSSDSATSSPGSIPTT